MNKPLPLPPGPELDALIAEKVFGFDLIDDGEAHGDSPSGTYSILKSHGDACPSCRAVGVCRDRSVPRYSTDIASAWSIVEAVKAKGYRMCIESSAYTTNVTFYTLGDRPVAYSAMAKEATHAICLAALKAVGHE